MATKREIRALVRRLLQRAQATWDEPGKVIDNLAALHDELEALLGSSGLYTPREIRRLMAELELLSLRHAREIGALARAAQVTAWQNGRENFEDTMGTLEGGFVKGLSGAEPELVQAYLTTDRITAVTVEMQALIRQQVISGVYLERTPYEVMAQITNVLGIRDRADFRRIGTTGVSAKAERILRTELMTIQNAGAWQAMQQASRQFPDLTEVWMATGDKRTRFTHLAAHGQKKEKGFFTIGGFKARFPGDPTLPPQERINCRCTQFAYREEWGAIDDLLGPLAGQIEVERERRKENLSPRSTQRKHINHGEHRENISHRRAQRLNAGGGIDRGGVG
jgi:hypothetical protein